MPPNKDTKPKNHHGVHYIKIFPISNQFIDKYNIDGSEYLKIVDEILHKSEREIVCACQTYLAEYEKGNRHKFSPDIDGIINMLDNLEH